MRFSIPLLAVALSLLLSGCDDDMNVRKRADGLVVYERPEVETINLNLGYGKFERRNDCIVLRLGDYTYTPVLSSRVEISSQSDPKQNRIKLGEEYALSGIDTLGPSTLKIDKDLILKACGYPLAFIGIIQDAKDVPPPAPPPQ